MKRTRLSNPSKSPIHGIHLPRQAWNDMIPERAYRLALMGATDKMMAAAFGVNINCIQYWKRHKPEFKEAVYRGGMEADAKVAESLYKRAIGYTYKESHKTFDKDGALIEEKQVVKYLHPDSWAAFHWLSIRQREYWAEVFRIKSEQNVNVNFYQHVDLSDFTTQELKAMEKMGLKQLADGVRKN